MSQAKVEPPQPDIAGSALSIIDLCVEVPGPIGEAIVCAQGALDRHRTGRAPKRSAADCVRHALNQRFGTSLRAAERTTTANVDDVVTSLRLRGIDGEDLIWSIIRYEAQHHVNLIWMAANRLAARHPGYTAEDLAGWGWLGLRQAMRQFEPQRGFRFSTYAVFRITGAMRDGVRDENPVPKRLLTLQRKVAMAREMLHVDLGREPTIDEIADFVDEDAGFLDRILPRLDVAASVNELDDLRAADGRPPIEPLTDTTDPADLAADELLRRDIDRALSSLDDDTRTVVGLVLRDGESIAAAKRAVGCSDREVRRLLDDGQRALAATLAQWKTD